jgi:secretion/DNA translocation related CpaE-like protein
MATTALIATADPTLLDDLLRLAAAADAETEVARDADEIRAAWPRAPLVLVGQDLADDLAARRPPRRPGVVLVASEGDDELVYRAAVGLGAQDVATLPQAQSWLVERLAGAAEPPGPCAVQVCVVGGRGGAGASVLATMLALSGARNGFRTLLADGDPFGGGLDLMLGQETADGTRWPELAARRGRLSSGALLESLPRLDELSILSWDRGAAQPIPAEAMRSVLDAAGRGFDFVVVDLPRYLDAGAAEALQTCVLTLLVVPAEVRAAVASDRLLTSLRRHASDIRVVVARPAPGGLTPDTVARALGLPLAGVLDRDRRIAAALEYGDLPNLRRRSRVSDFCDLLIAELGLSDRQRGEAT